MDNKFNKKIFAMLLERAKGPRSWRQFSFDCDISYVQMRKLAHSTQNNPPRPTLIKKIADHSFNEVDLEDFMFAAGMFAQEPRIVRPIAATSQTDLFFEKYKSLNLQQRKNVAEFVDYLSEKNERIKERK